MKKMLLILFAYVLGASSSAHAQDEKIDTAVISRIRNEGLNHSQVKAIAGNITDISGPRLTNSPGFNAASAWIISQLSSWGLTGVKRESWGKFGYGWSTEKSYAAMSSPYFSNLICYQSPWSGGTNGLITAPVFLLGKKYDSSFIVQHAGEIKNHIVLYKTDDTTITPASVPEILRYSDSALANMGDMEMMSDEVLKTIIPQLNQHLRMVKLIQQCGAIAIIELSHGKGADGVVFADGFGGYIKKDEPALPKLIMEKEDYLKIQRLLEQNIEVKLDLDIRVKYFGDDLNGYNVIGEIAGTDPKLKSEIVMLGGHLDSWQSATGATDNAAGCIATLEAIRILKAVGVKPRRTIRIALWGGEEQILLGSFGYVRNHFGDPAGMQVKAEQGKISAYYNLDNGTGKIRGIFAQGNQQVMPIFSKWLEPFRDLGASTVTIHNTGGTDHLSFDAIGIPAFQFIQDPLDYDTRTHHTNFDTYDHLAFDDLKQAATIIAAFVYNTAMRPEMLPRKPLPKPGKFLLGDIIKE
jgi:carboxypeptidase Q